MTVRPIELEQRFAARLAGLLYLLTMALSVFSESYVRGRLLVRGDAAQTASNIVASERLFRISIVSDLIMIAGVVILVWALYVVLRPINRNVALLAAFLRLVGDAIAAAAIVHAFLALRLLSGSDYLRAFGTQQLQVLARVLLGGQGTGLQIAFVFLGLGSTVFSYLWFRSRYVPRVLAAWGVFSSLLLAIGTLLFIVFPAWGAVVGLAYMMPMGLYEVGLGLWLLVKGIRAPRAAQ